MAAIIKTNVTAGTVLTNANETVVATVVCPPTGPGYSTVTLSGMVDISPGATVTGLNLKIRKNSLTGTIVSQTTDNTVVTATVVGASSIDGVDVPGDTSGQVYVLTLQQVGGSSNGTANLASLVAALSA